MLTKSIEIRDLRQQDWLWTSKSLLFHEKIDGNTYKVYCGLSAYANNETQQAFPSVETLSTKLHISRNTIMKSLATLKECKFIEIEKKTGEHNVYILLQVTGDKIFKHTEEKAVDRKEIAATSPTPTVSNTPTLFQILWAIYPNKANRKVGQAKFDKLSKEKKIAIITDVKRRKEYHGQWMKGFVPHLATYINQERWNDPITLPDKKPEIGGPIIHPDIKKQLFKKENERRFEASRESNQGASMLGELLKH